MVRWPKIFRRLNPRNIVAARKAERDRADARMMEQFNRPHPHESMYAETDPTKKSGILVARLTEKEWELERKIKKYVDSIVWMEIDKSKKEMILLRNALLSLNMAGKECYFESKHGWIALGGSSPDTLILYLKECEEQLIKLQRFTEDIIKLAELVRDKLLGIRGGSIDTIDTYFN